MSLNKRKYRESVKKIGSTSNIRRKEIFLYGKLKPLNSAVAYCNLHKCYLEPVDIREKRCNFKKCKHIKEL